MLAIFMPPNAALERLAHATIDKGYSPASPLQRSFGGAPE